MEAADIKKRLAIPPLLAFRTCSTVNRLIIATAMAALRFSPPATPLLAGERHLPDDVLQRLLVGLPLEDHRAAASVCKSFRRVIAGPRFLAERRRCGFAERGIVSVTIEHLHITNGDKTICIVHSGETARISGNFGLTGSTTDGGSRLFFSTLNESIWAVDSSRTWGRFATLPRVSAHSLEWHNGLLFLAGGFRLSDLERNSYSQFGLRGRAPRGLTGQLGGLYIYMLLRYPNLDHDPLQ